MLFTTDDSASPAGESADTLPLGRRPAAGSDVPVLVVAGNSKLSPPEPRIVRIDDEVVIGRADRGERNLYLDDRSVSRQHARVERSSDGGLDLVDLGSSNGTMVEGRPILPRKGLCDGDALLIGGHVLVFRFLSEKEIAAIEEERQAPVGPVPTLSGRMALALRELRQLACSSRRECVLLVGEGGTGRQTCARAFHSLSGAQGDLLMVECAEPADFEAAIGRLASRGAGVGAASATFFLRDVDQVPRQAQERLRILLEQTFSSHGPRDAFPARVIAATAYGTTNMMIEPLLNCFSTLWFPALRNRKEDIPNLVARQVVARGRKSLEPSALFELLQRPWSENIPEVEFTATAAAEAAALDQAESIAIRHLLPPGYWRGTRPAGATLAKALGDFAALYGLTESETEVLRLAAREGLTNKRLAGRRGTSTKTIEHHWRSIFRKTGRESQVAVLSALLVRAFRTIATRRVSGFDS